MKLFSIVLLALMATVAVAATNLSTTLTWVAPTSNTDGSTPTALVYNVYEGPTASTLNTTPIVAGTSALTIVTTAGAVPGATACFAVSAIEGVVAGQAGSGMEGALSTVVCKTFPLSVPGAPSSLVAK